MERRRRAVDGGHHRRARGAFFSSFSFLFLTPPSPLPHQPKTTNSGDLFAVAPIAPGTRAQVVEPVSDSSRNFVLRLADAATGRHAFVGLGFAERPDAFDFNVALGDHDKHVRRAREIEEARGAASSAAAAAASASASAAAAAPTTSRQQQALLPDESSSDSVRSAVSALYGAAGRDLSLKEGETIKVAVVKSGGGGGGGGGGGAATTGVGGEAGTAPGGFLARQQTASATAAGGGLFSLPPPPGTRGIAAPPAPAPPASSGDPFAPSNGAPSAASEDKGWATFE